MYFGQVMEQVIAYNEILQNKIFTVAFLLRLKWVCSPTMVITHIITHLSRNLSILKLERYSTDIHSPK